MNTSAAVASRFKQRMKDRIPYSASALREDLRRIRIAWGEFQESRDRDAVYGYLDAVFQLVLWWTAEGRAVKRACWALRLSGVDLPERDEPFGAIILCTSDQAKVDKRTRSKWSRVLRYAAEYKDHAEPLGELSGARAASTRALRDLLAASGDAAGIRTTNSPGPEMPKDAWGRAAQLSPGDDQSAWSPTSLAVAGKRA